MLSGGADGGIAMWDLEAAEESRRRGIGVMTKHTPLGSVVRYVAKKIATLTCASC